MVRSMLVALLGGLVLCPVVAKENPSRDVGQSFVHLQSLIDQAQGLQYEVEKLEHRLEYPAGDQLTVYLSVDSFAPSFTPLQTILLLNGKPMIQLEFSHHQKQQIRQGRMFRLLSQKIAHGTHTLSATVSGINAKGELVVESLERRFEKRDISVLVQLGIDQNNGPSHLQSRFW